MKAARRSAIGLKVKTKVKKGSNVKTGSEAMVLNLEPLYRTFEAAIDFSGRTAYLLSCELVNKGPCFKWSNQESMDALMYF